MGEEMIDKEKIEQAAFDFIDNGECEVMDTHAAHQDSFKAGIKWRDANPSPEVQALVAALKAVETAATKGDETTTEIECHNIAQDALTNWDKK